MFNIKEYLIDKIFPDKRVYCGKNYKWCETDSWDDPCSHAILYPKKNIAICGKSNKFRKDCPNRI